MQTVNNTKITEENKANGFFKLWHDIVLIVGLLNEY
jgi:hypothetical protein